MVYAVMLRNFGGPEVLEPENIELPAPSAHEVRLRQTAIGVNFIDTYFRTGLYPVDLPFVPGEEGIGIIEAVGSSVKEFRTGERVAYSTNYHNSYLSHKNIAAQELVPVPEKLTDSQVVSSLLRGLTAEYLLFRCYTLKEGQSVLVHAAAGGVGSILCQWAKNLGARVFGTVSSPEKTELARRYGCDEVIDYSKDSFLEVIQEKTAGELVDVVYDGVGRMTFNDSLQCVKPRGLLVSFGNASGAPEPLNVLDLSKQGSIFLTRPRLTDYTMDPVEYRTAANRYLSILKNDQITLPDTIEIPLKEASRAHQLLEDRSVTATPVLVP